MNAPLLLTDHVALKGWRRKMQAGNLHVGFVPTMGKLHEGHLSLMRQVLDSGDCDRLIVSIYVNPTQFGAGEDFDGYPRELEADIEKLASVGAAACFAPADDLVYPAGDTCSVRVEWGQDRLCGAQRPGHFDGVTNVLVRLFNLVRPHMVVFGQKDAQQALIVKRMVDGLHFPLKLRLGETLREPDGLAMSSRNSYLSPEERQRATVLNRALSACGEALRAGERDAGRLAADGLAMLAGTPEVAPEYFEVVDPETLAPPEKIGDGILLAACAARVGPARLIDNHVFRIGEDGVHETLLF